jgi:hypothetical protein
MSFRRTALNGFRSAIVLRCSADHNLVVRLELTTPIIQNTVTGLLRYAARLLREAAIIKTQDIDRA